MLTGQELSSGAGDDEEIALEPQGPEFKSYSSIYYQMVQDKSLLTSEPEFLYRTPHDTVVASNELTHAQCLAQGLAHSKCSLNCSIFFFLLEIYQLARRLVF